MHHHVRIDHVMCEIRPISWPQYFPATQAKSTRHSQSTKTDARQIKIRSSRVKMNTSKPRNQNIATILADWRRLDQTKNHIRTSLHVSPCYTVSKPHTENFTHNTYVHQRFLDN